MFDQEDLEIRQLPFDWMGKKYLLMEAPEEAAVKYRNSSLKAAVFNAEGNIVSINDPASVEPPLVAACLFQCEENGELKLGSNKLPVSSSVAFINTLPSRLVRKMFEWVKENSHLDEDTEESLKKEIKQKQEKLQKLRASKKPGDGTTTTSD